MFKIKSTTDGKPDRFKARLVAQGYSQKYGTDYDEVFAPVVRITTIRMLLSLAGKKNYRVWHIDIKTAFLNGILKEVIYMQQPPGREDENHREWGCRLNKSLYGLRQAAKDWYERLHEVLTEYNFVRSEDDPCLYKHGNSTISYLGVHVDDIILVTSSPKRAKDIMDALNEEFDITNLGEISCYLGIKIIRNQQGEFSINQSDYIKKILNRTKLDQAKVSSYPMDTGYEKERPNSPEIKSGHYNKLIGALLYVSVNTRPDISAPVALLAQHIKDTRQIDWNEAQRICRYLKGTINYELKLSNVNEEQGLIVYADANWAEDRENRKSNTGYVVKIFGGTVSWTCKKQDCVSTSSTEAEIIALSEASKECVAIRNILKFLNEERDGPTTIFEDNQSCINNIHSVGKSPQTKHIDSKYLYTKELIKNGIVNVIYCPSAENLADILTKALGPQKTRALALKIGLITEERPIIDQ